MGFDVTAANIIFFIAFLAIGSVALGAYWSNADHVEDARRFDHERSAELAHTNMTITSASYDGGAQRFTVQVENTGSTVIDLSELGYLIDGTLVADATIEDIDVVGEGSPTDVWLPLETIDVDFLPVTTSPGAFQIVAQNGASANWRS